MGMEAATFRCGVTCWVPIQVRARRLMPAEPCKVTDADWDERASSSVPVPRDRRGTNHANIAAFGDRIVRIE